MADTLTRVRILEAAEDVLRRFGPRKTTVVDVARELGVSHGAVYRHFPSKVALRDAVTERWLHRISEPLAQIATGEGAADVRLRRWVDALVAAKRRKVRDDAEMFAAYHGLALESRDVIAAHVGDLVGQIARIVADGIASGVFAPGDPQRLARSVFDATNRFHNPAHSAGWDEAGIDADLDALMDLLLSGLRPR